MDKKRNNSVFLSKNDQKSVLLVKKRPKMHKRDKKMTKKVLYKNINSAFLQAAEDRGQKPQRACSH